MSETLTHLNAAGEAQMVDVGEKSAEKREAKAQASLKLSKKAMHLLISGENKKGDAFTVAKIAGIQAAKKTADLIPLCHPLALSSIAIDFTVDEQACEVIILSHCKLTGRTGVEMEALTAASVAALTLYDMCKAVDKGIIIQNIHLLEKLGGKSGHWLSANCEANNATHS